MPRVSRRKLLIGAGAAAALPTGWLAVHANTWRSTIIADYLRGQLPGLAVSSTNMEQFAEQYVERDLSGGGYRAMVHHEKMFLMLANPMLAAVAPEATRSAFEALTRGLMTKFLLSTDFFGAGGQRPESTTYVGFSDPYESACSNPLANLELEA